MPLDISCANLQSAHPINKRRLIKAVRTVLASAQLAAGEISITVVDNPRMHELNREHLGHDYPTDVLSFVYMREGNRIEGEIIVSADYAAAEATRYGWPADDELLLYVVHGGLHLVGYDDTTAEGSTEMRQQERAILATFDLIPPGRE